MVITCKRCQALINVPAADRVVGVTTCEQCGTLLEVPASEAARPVVGREAAPPRAVLSQPEGLDVAETESDPAAGYRGAKPSIALVITRPHRRLRGMVALAVAGALLVAVIAAWVVAFVWLASVWLLLVLAPLTVAVLVSLDVLIRSAINRSVVRADPRAVRVWHGPLRSELSAAEVLADDLVQLFSCARERFGSGKGPYQVKALLRGDVAMVLIDGLQNREQALYIEQRLEGVLGSTDRAVAVELPRDHPPEEKPTARPADLEPATPLVPRSWLWRMGIASLLSALPAAALAVVHWPRFLGATAVGNEPETVRLSVDATRPVVFFEADVERHMLPLGGRCGRQSGCDMSPAFDFVMLLQRDPGGETRTLRCDATHSRWGIGPSRSSGGRMYEEWWSWEMADCALRLEPGQWLLSVQRKTTQGGYEGDRILQSRVTVKARRR